MPTIQSRKYEDHIQYVTPETWELMKQKGLARRHRVLDEDDLKEAVGDTSPISFEQVINTMVEEEELSREEMIALLDEKEIEYSKYYSTNKLKELLDNG